MMILADLGACPAHVTIRDQILLFSHTILPKSARICCPRPLTGPHPLRQILDPPLDNMDNIETYVILISY